MTAVTLLPDPSRFEAGGGKSGYNMLLQLLVAGVVLLLCCVFVPWNNVPVVSGLLFGNHIVDASSLVIFVPPVGCKRF